MRCAQSHTLSQPTDGHFSYLFLVTQLEFIYHYVCMCEGYIANATEENTTSEEVQIIILYDSRLYIDAMYSPNLDTLVMLHAEGENEKPTQCTP